MVFDQKWPFYFQNRIVILLYTSLLHLSESNEIIPEAFENLDFGLNSKSLHQLIAGGAVVALISVILVSSSTTHCC
jgi:hypothetical protein